MQSLRFSKLRSKKRWLRYSRTFSTKLLFLTKNHYFLTTMNLKKDRHLSATSSPPVHRTQNMARWQTVLNSAITTQVLIVFTTNKMDICFLPRHYHHISSNWLKKRGGSPNALNYRAFPTVCFTCIKDPPPLKLSL